MKVTCRSWMLLGMTPCVDLFVFVGFGHYYIWIFVTDVLGAFHVFHNFRARDLHGYYDMILYGLVIGLDLILSDSSTLTLELTSELYLKLGAVGCFGFDAEMWTTLEDLTMSDVPGDGSHVHTHDHDGSEAPDESPDSILSSEPKPLGKHRPPPPPSILSPGE
ncbi:hypothetical protein Tco_0821776 [Tanacetum coccineum]|uniref:Uncharacterized protein n=1 Tax=Tanacetum coccineum TaxID=301880 RepID=A0ABQ5AG64_9ASTR